MATPTPPAAATTDRLRLVRILWCAACAGVILWVAHSESLSQGRDLDSYPINGDWQSFNPAHRWLGGQFPGRDFNVYLGLGPTLLTTLGTKWWGGNFGDSLAAVAWLCALLHAFAWGTLSRCGGLSRTASWTTGALAVVMFAAPYKLWLPLHLRAVLIGACEHLFHPANSVLGLRSAAPFLAAMLLLVTWNRWADVRCRPWRRAVWLGAVGGLFLPWSNDFGLTTCAAIGLSASVAWYRDTSWRQWFVCLGLHALTSLMVGALVVCLATAGAPLRWWQYNFLGVAREQFWYFNGEKVLRWSDVPLWSEVFLGIGVVLVWLIRIRRRSHARPDDLFLPLVVAPLMATCLSVVAGHLEWRYTFPLTRVLYIAVPCAVVTLLEGVLHFVRKPRSTPETAREDSPDFWGTQTPPIRDGLLSPRWDLVFCLLLATQTTILTRRWFREEQRQPAPAIPWSLMVTPPALPPAPIANEAPLSWLQAIGDVGAGISERFSKAIAIAGEIRDDVTARKIPPDRRLASTYTSLIDNLVGAANPCRSDYLIHALGPTERGLHYERLRDAAPEYFLTIREDWDGYEAWLQRQNWPLYRWLLAYYEPYDRTYYAIVWKRRAEPRRLKDWPVDVRVLDLGPATTGLEFRLTPKVREQLLATGFDGSDDLIVEATVRYGTGVTAPLWKHGVIRQHLRATDIEQPFKLWGTTEWGLPLAPTASTLPEMNSPPGRPVAGERTATFPLRMRPEECRTVILTVAPTEVSRLSISHAAARIACRSQEFDRAPLVRLRAAAWTTIGWKNGIRTVEPEHPTPSSLVAKAAEFVVSDDTDLRDLSVGDELVFAMSGRRSITGIAGSRVTVSGLPLDAAGDGFPHPIRIVQPRLRPAASETGDAWISLNEITTPDWRAGVCVDPGQTAVFVRFPEQIVDLKPGTILQFAASGERRVETLDTAIIRVSGPQLDPAGDGPPQRVRWRDAPRSARQFVDRVRPTFQTDPD